MKLRASLALNIGFIALCGCTAEESPSPAPLKQADQQTFQIQSLTANGRDLTLATDLALSPGAAVQMRGAIRFQETPPHVILVQFIDNALPGEVIASQNLVAIDPPPRGSSGPTKFELTLNAPTSPGRYILRVIAPPSKAPRSDRGEPVAPRIYALADAIVEP